MIIANSSLKRLNELAIRVRAADLDAVVTLAAESCWTDFEHLCGFVARAVKEPLAPAAFDALADAWAGLHDPESIDQVIGRIGG